MVVVWFLVFVIIISIKIITIVIIIFIIFTHSCTNGGRVLVLVIPGNECSSSRRSWHFCRFPGFLPSQLCLGAGWPVRQDHYLSHTATYQHCSATYHCTCHCVIRWNCHQTSGTIGNAMHWQFSGGALFLCLMTSIPFLPLPELPCSHALSSPPTLQGIHQFKAHLNQFWAKIQYTICLTKISKIS